VPDGRVILIAGATASGKSALALEVALALGGELVSVDSAAVYRGLDVGTDKPDALARRAVAHHLLDVADPFERFTLAAFLAQARAALDRIAAAGRPAVLVGGTGLYARALVEGYLPQAPADPALRRALDAAREREGAEALWRRLAAADPAAAARLAPRDGVRVQRALERLAQGGAPGTVDPALSLVGRVEAFVLDVDPPVLAARIDARARSHVERGLLDETLRILGRGVPPQAGALRSIGYREAVAWARGLATADEVVARTARATRQLAKRQRTWWRAVAWAVHGGADEVRRRLIG